MMRADEARSLANMNRGTLIKFERERLLSQIEAAAGTGAFKLHIDPEQWVMTGDEMRAFLGPMGYMVDTGVHAVQRGGAVVIDWSNPR